jgi:hypothetical protein
MRRYWPTSKGTASDRYAYPIACKHVCKENFRKVQNGLAARPRGAKRRPARALPAIILPEAAVNELAKVEIPVEPETARALADAHRREAVGRLVDRMVRPTGADDPLAALLEATARRARESGLTDEEIDAELAAYNAERRRG